MAPKLTSSSPTPYPMYNTTYTLHRLSPLSTGTTALLTPSTLTHHARRLREILIGDVMRGVRIGLADTENDAVSLAGKLESVTWRLLPAEEEWRGMSFDDEDGEENGDEEDETISLEPCQGIRVVVAYERSKYTALLLRDGNEDLGNGFHSFPLLFTKMPASLKDVFTTYLSETFDARVSNLSLSGDYVTSVFEKYISELSLDEDGKELGYMERIKVLRGIIKDVEVFIGFDLPSSSGALKTMEIHLTREDIPRLISRGKGIRNAPESPFLNALEIYVKRHLALDLKHEAVKIVRIACGAFVLGAEGRVKLTAPAEGEGDDGPQRRATRALVDGLVTAARGGLWKGREIG